MKKELKLLGKYIGVSVLIVFLVMTVFNQIVSVIDAQVHSKYILSDLCITDKGYNAYLQDLEESWQSAINGINENMAKDNVENFPALAAMIKLTEIGNARSELAETMLVTLIGVILGIACYFAKKEYKRIIHYIIIAIFIFLVLNVCISFLVSKVNSIFYDYDEFDIEMLGEVLKFTTVPYIIICIVIYVAMCLISKRKTDILNKEIKK